MFPSASIAVVGPGRMGAALSAALRAAGCQVEGPLGRDVTPESPIVILCVPDGNIGDAANAMPDDAIVGHTSGATTLGDCDFSLHPLMTVPDTGATFDGVPAAVAGHPVATQIAETLGMRPFHVADEDRAAYHAAAAIASNYLVVIESAAEQLAATAGVDRAALVPLVRATLANWEGQGRAALTGPAARGDLATLARHRAAIAERAPELRELYDVLATEAARC